MGNGNEETAPEKGERLDNQWNDALLRQPLRVLQENSAQLLRSPLTGEQRQLVEQLRRAAETLTASLEDLFEPPVPHLQPDIFEPREILEAVIDGLAKEARGRRLELAYSLQYEGPVQGTSHLLKRALKTLLEVTLRLAESGEVLIRVSYPTPEQTSLELDFQVSASRIAWDSIDRSLLPMLSQGRGVARKIDDLTLELFALQRQLQRQGGALGLEKVHALSFALKATLPMGRPVQAVGLDNAAVRVPQRLGPGPERALFVGDESMVNALLRLQLGEWGLRVDTTSRISQALGLLRGVLATRLPYSMVMVDAGATAFRALEFLETLAASETLRTLPIFLLCHPDEADLAGMFSLGLTLHKCHRPVKYAALRGLLTEILQRDLVVPSPLANTRSGAVEGALQGAIQGAIQGALQGGEALGLGASPVEILVVEDNSVNQRVILRMLEKLHFRAVLAENGHNALGLLKSRRFALGLVDYYLPDLNGPELVETIRQWEGTTQHLPLIGMTGSSFAREHQRFSASGIDGLLLKPVRLQELQEVLSHHLPREAVPLTPVPKKGGVDWREVDSEEHDPGSEDFSGETSELSTVKTFPQQPVLKPPGQGNAPTPGSLEGGDEGPRERPVLDLSTLRTLRGTLDGEQQGESEDMIPLFLEQLSASHRSVLEAYGQQDPQALTRAAHAMKSVCVYLGAQRLAQRCDALQAQAETGTLTEAGSALHQLVQELDRFKRALELASLYENNKLEKEKTE